MKGPPDLSCPIEGSSPALSTSFKHLVAFIPELQYTKAVVIYEVNLRIDSQIASQYMSWLPTHTEKMLTMEGFLSAEVFENESEELDDDLHIVIHYRVKDRPSLEKYLTGNATSMRKEVTDLFGNNFSAARRILVTAVGDGKKSE